MKNVSLFKKCLCRIQKPLVENYAPTTTMYYFSAQEMNESVLDVM